MARIPALHFDSADLPVAERLAHWKAAVRQYEVAFAPGVDPASFRVVADVWQVGDLVLSATQASPMRLVRSAELAQTDGNDQFRLVLLRRGHWSGRIGERMLTAEPGQIVMLDLSRPFETIGTDRDIVTLHVSRAPLVGAAPGVDLHGFVLEGAVGRALVDHFLMLARRLPHMEPDEAPEVARAAVALAASCLAAAPKSRDAGAPARENEARRRVFRYLDQNLGKPDLTAARVCKDVGLSRSALYRAFAPLGGFADYVRARRLEAAHARLEDPAAAHRISDIADAFGFVSDAHFSRVFRQRYGYNPRRARNGDASALRELAAIVGSRDAPEVFQAWLKQVG
jgi:AraC-like DNA-binding protein